MPALEYDVFFSHAWADGERPQQIADALAAAGLRVWFDAAEIDDFASITHAVTEGLAQSKALLAYYSATYPLRRACQWELTAAFLAAQTEGDPRRRVLVINPESGADHIHPIELRDAKFRNAPNTDGEMQQLVQAIVKHVGQLRVPRADIHPLTAPNWYGMTPVGSTRFVGRLKEMWQMHSLLHTGDVAQITGAAAATGGIGQVQGLGGVGKSLLAEEYALHFGSAYPGGVFWLRAYGNDDAKDTLGSEEREALRADQVRQMSERLGIVTHELTAEQIEGALSRKIATENKPCLWVVDDVPNGSDGDALRRWFAPHALARTLITTRSREYGALAKGIDLSLLTPDEAFQLLTSRRKPTNKDEEGQAHKLAEDLGYHALALDVTASALMSYGGAEPYRQFREDLADPGDDAPELSTELADALPNGHEKSIAQTMLRSIRNLGAEGIDFLRLASVLAVAPIPASLVTAVFGNADGLDRTKAEQRQRKAFRDVTTASLAETAGENQNARSVHTLVSRAVRFQEKSAPERTQALRTVAIVALNEDIARAAEDPRLHRRIEFQVAHARQLVTKPTGVSEANLLGWVARYDLERGSYASARVLYERELEFRRRRHGPEHPITLTSMGNLALALHAQGDSTVARKVNEEVLTVRSRILGSEHPETLASMNNLADILRDQGDLAGARRLLEETITARSHVSGPKHPATLVSMSNLAGVLKASGNLADARKVNEKVLNTRRRVLGPEHLDTVLSMNNLAATLYAVGDLTGSRGLWEDVVSIRNRVLGSEHPDTLTSLSNLASVLQAQRDWSGSRQLDERTLAIRRQKLGPEHPDTLLSMSNLAHTLYAQGDLSHARTLQEEALATAQRVLGLDHPDTISTMHNLAATLNAQGDCERALKLGQKTLAARKRVLGPQHPDTSRSALNLFVTLVGLKDREAALTVLNQDLLWLLDRDPSTLGADQRQIRDMVAQVVRKVDSA